MTFFGTTEHFSGRTGALRWSILVGKQKHNVQKPRRVGDTNVAAVTSREDTLYKISSLSGWILLGGIKV